MHFRKRRLLKPPRIKSKTGCPEVGLLTKFHCNTNCELTVNLRSRSGVLEDTFWSPWPMPRKSSRRSSWPWLRTLKSSKLALFSARGQHYFFELLKVCGAPETFFRKRFFLGIAWKIFVKTFFFGKHLRLCPWPWPRAFLSLASTRSVLGRAVLVLGLEPRALDSTSGG